MYTTSDFSSVYDSSDIGQNSNQGAVGPTTNSNLNIKIDKKS